MWNTEVATNLQILINQIRQTNQIIKNRILTPCQETYSLTYNPKKIHNRSSQKCPRFILWTRSIYFQLTRNHSLMVMENKVSIFQFM